MRYPGLAFRRIAICLGFVGACLAAPLGAATITVNSPADTAVATDGDCTLREAIANANLAAGGDLSGGDCAASAAGADTIDFDAAVTGTITLGSALPSLSDNVVIAGPGAGVLAVDGAALFRVFEINTGVTATISGLTIAHGLAVQGGGIFNNGTLTITNSTLSGNSAAGPFTSQGGGIFNGGALTITYSTLSGNHCSGSGGGIFNGGTLTIANSTLSGNDVLGYPFDSGGGGISNGGTLTITNSALSGNSAKSYYGISSGGGISNGGTLTITNSTLSGNSAASFYGSSSGGGIFNFNGGTLTITNSTLSGNSAASYFYSSGGGISNGGTVTISSTTLSDNSATTFSNGGISGGGISNGGTVTIKNSIVANSLGGDCSGGVFTDLGGNLDTDAGCPLPTVTAAALNLGPLALNPPGPTPTHALLSPSAAIDAASDCNDAFGSAVPIDQRGVARPMDGDGDGVAACDIGAYELMIEQPIPAIPALGGLGLASLVALLMGAGLLLLRRADAG